MGVGEGLLWRSYKRGMIFYEEATKRNDFYGEATKENEA
jgi:hypothetical protein